MLNLEQIKEIIPHREPFLMIDRAEILEAGKRARGYKFLSPQEPFFKGHFPDYPIMPAVLIVESLAQLAALLVLNCEENRGKKLYFTSLNGAKFRKKVLPGETLELFVEIVSFRHSFYFSSGQARLNGKKVCSAELGFVVSDS